MFVDGSTTKAAFGEDDEKAKKRHLVEKSGIFIKKHKNVFICLLVN
jgi:hypothetical protein